MPSDVALEADIRNLIRQAYGLVHGEQFESHAANDLVARIYSCADRAAKAGFVFSEKKLDRLAWALE